MPIKLVVRMGSISINIHFDQLNHNFIDILFIKHSTIAINYMSARCEPNSRLGALFRF